MRKLLLCLAVTVLSGCTTWSSFQKSVDELDGKPLKEVSAKLGYPTGQREIAGMALMYWDSTGATGPASTVSKRACRITFRVDSQEVLHDPQIEGRKKSCRGYMQALNQTSDSPARGQDQP